MTAYDDPLFDLLRSPLALVAIVAALAAAWAWERWVIGPARWRRSVVLGVLLRSPVAMTVADLVADIGTSAVDEPWADAAGVQYALDVLRSNGYVSAHPTFRDGRHQLAYTVTTQALQ